LVVIHPIVSHSTLYCLGTAIKAIQRWPKINSHWCFTVCLHSGTLQWMELWACMVGWNSDDDM